MTVDELSKLAAKNAPMPDLISPADTMLFQTLRGIYIAYSAKRIDREQAVNEKKQAIAAYEYYKKLVDDTYVMYQENTKAVYSLLREYERTKSAETAHEMLKILLRRKDW